MIAGLDDDSSLISTSRPEQNGRRLANDILVAYSWKKFVYLKLNLQTFYPERSIDDMIALWIR